MLVHQGGNLVVGDHTSAFSVDRDVHGACHTNGVRHLNLALGGQSSGHNVLGHIAGGISSRAVHLRRIFTREGATTVRASAAVSVHNDLATGQAAITLWAANHKATCRVDQVLGVLQPLFGQHRLDDFLNDGFVEAGLHFGGRLALVGAVLGRQHHGVNAVGLAVHVAHGHLALGIGAQERQAAVFAQLRLTLDQTVRVINGRRHQVGGFAASVTKHQALVASAGVEVVVRRVVHTLCNVIGLLVVAHHDGAAFVVNAVLGVVVANALDGVARHLDVVDVGVGGDFTRQNHQTGVGQGFGSHAAAGVLFKNRVENGV